MSSNLQSLVNAKAALDLGLLTEDDYSRVKESFLKAQQLRSAIDAGLIEEGQQVEQAREGFVSMVLGDRQEQTVASSQTIGKGRGGKAPPPVPPPMAKDPMATSEASSKPRAAPSATVPAPAKMPAPPPMPPPMQQQSSTGGGRAPVPKNIPSTGGSRAGTGGGKSMSGISLSEDAVNIFYLVRSKSRYRWVLWKINDGATEVVIDAVGEPSSTYSDFLHALPENDCRYAVYDYEFVGGDGQTHNKIVFINWAPDTAKVKSKMMYASTKDFFKSNLEGLSVEFQGSDFDEISDEEVGASVRALKRNY